MIKLIYHYICFFHNRNEKIIIIYKLIIIKVDSRWKQPELQTHTLYFLLFELLSQCFVLLLPIHHDCKLSFILYAFIDVTSWYNHITCVIIESDPLGDAV